MDSETLIDRIYEAASIPELWPEVLEEFGAIVQTPRAMLGIRRKDGWAGAALSPAFNAATTEYLQSDVPARTEIADRLIAENHAGFVRSDDVFTPDEWERDPFRREWARKWGFNHGIATAIQTLSKEMVIVAQFAGQAEGRFWGHHRRTQRQRAPCSEGSGARRKRGPAVGSTMDDGVLKFLAGLGVAAAAAGNVVYVVTILF